MIHSASNGIPDTPLPILLIEFPQRGGLGLGPVHGPNCPVIHPVIHPVIGRRTENYRADFKLQGKMF